ncbi:AlpA family transcriptional regulator [Halarcobacter bivalviorum]|nr:AlpA family transcriptional regulator [Halarcobacter bivalviorum]
MLKIELIEMLRTNYKRSLLSKKETAKELNISQATIDRLRQSGQIKSKRVGGGIYFTLDEIARFICES